MHSMKTTALSSFSVAVVTHPRRLMEGRAGFGLTVIEGGSIMAGRHKSKEPHQDVERSSHLNPQHEAEKSEPEVRLTYEISKPTTSNRLTSPREALPPKPPQTAPLTVWRSAFIYTRL